MNSGSNLPLESLIKDHGRMVFATPWRILGNADDADDAEDVLQDVFLKILDQPCRGWPGPAMGNLPESHGHEYRNRPATQETTNFPCPDQS
jgi:hypothetical protein